MDHDESGSLLAVMAESDRVGRALSWVQGVEIQRCMEAKGFDYIVIGKPDLPARSREALVAAALRAPFSLRDGRFAYTASGTDPSDVSEPVQTADGVAFRQALFSDQLDEHVVYDFDGEPLAAVPLNSGCQGEAVLAVFGSKDAYFAYFDILIHAELGWQSVIDQLPSQVDFERLNGAWSACMGRRGFDFGTVFEPANRDYEQSGQPSKLEIQTATADADCRAEVGLTPQNVMPIIAGFEAEIIDKYSLELAELLQIERDILERFSGSEV